MSLKFVLWRSVGTMLALIMVMNGRPLAGVGCGLFLREWPPSALWVGLNNPLSLNLGLYAAWWAHCICHHELRPTSVSHPIFLNCSLCLVGGKYHQKLLTPSLAIFTDLIWLFKDAVLIFFFYTYCFNVLSSGWFITVVFGSISIQVTSQALKKM